MPARIGMRRMGLRSLSGGGGSTLPPWLLPENLIDGIPPSLYADFGRGVYALNGAEKSFSDLFTLSSGSKTVIGQGGTLVTVPANTPAFDYSLGRRSFLLECASTNILLNSSTLSTQSVTTTATTYTLSFFGTGTVALSGTYSGSLVGAGANTRSKLTFTATAGTLTCTVSGSVTNAQLEANSAASSYTGTGGSQVTRVTDLCAFTSAANLSIPQSAATMAWRGNVKTAAASQQLVGLSGWALLRGATAVPAQLGVDGSSNANVPLGSVLPGDIGAAFAWNASGRVGAANGGATTSASTVVDKQMPPFFLGSSAGMTSGAIHELGAFIAWPVRGSNAAIQSQARAYA